MALYIRIEKILENNDMGYYHVSTTQFGEANFYAGIDKKNQIIYCYFTQDFSYPVGIIDLKNPYARFDTITGISADVLGKLFYKTRQIFKLNKFPECLDDAA